MDSDEAQPSTPTQRAIHVLGIESSCDDTGVAVVRQDGKVLSNCINSQLVKHLNHGGILPMVAKEYHLENIDRVAKQAMAESGLESVSKNIDAIAVTNRPGLEGSLQVGLNYARKLAKKYCKPLIPVHHMRAHALMPLLENRSIRFPFLTLLLSGGHCLLAICERHDKFHLLGQSLDDAPGDLLDKVARRTRLRSLGAPFDRISGGAAIELIAKRANANRFKYFNDELSIPMLRKPGCNLSFSGYRGIFEKIVPLIDEIWMTSDRDKIIDELSHLFSSLQRGILVQVFRKLQRALMFYRAHWRYNNPQAFQAASDASDRHLGFGIRRNDELDSEWLDIVVSGGVAANEYLLNGIADCCSTEIDSTEPLRIYAPSRSLCNDNGLMIAWNGMLKYLDMIEASPTSHDRKSGDLDDRIVFDPEEMDLLKASPTYPIGQDITRLVMNADFKLPKVRNRELKLGPPPLYGTC